MNDARAAGAATPARGADPLGRVLDAVDALSTVGAWAAVGCIFAILGLIAGEVAARNLFNYSIHFAWEFSAYFMGATFMLGAGYALRAGAQIRVNVLITGVGGNIARMIDLGATLLSAAIASYLSYALFLLTWLSWERGSKSAQASELPLWIPQLALSVGAAIFTVQLIARAARLLRREPGEDARLRLAQDIE
ncbi:MAG TPA: TRAP transporter small permease [Alphaproteobacteria bacterium]|nr:TRAP transporter small permease [Alphaproteobacteria bacterium]